MSLLGVLYRTYYQDEGISKRVINAIKYSLYPGSLVSKCHSRNSSLSAKQTDFPVSLECVSLVLCLSDPDDLLLESYNKFISQEMNEAVKRKETGSNIFESWYGMGKEKQENQTKKLTNFGVTQFCI